MITNPPNAPFLYTFRRCPYAMRARMALWNSQIKVEIREILLKNKPQSMLEFSPKGTVPVLVFPDDTILDESLDILYWCLTQNDKDSWLRKDKTAEITALINENDGSFKTALDRYKYSSRHPEEPLESYRQEGELFLQKLENRLTQTTFLLDDKISIVDIAIFPFIRQFAHVDKSWFDQAPYPQLQKWLEFFLASQLFADIMSKKPLWEEESSAIYNF